MQKLCAKCGSKLVELKKTQSTSGNSTFPLTTTTFRCTNDICQKNMDEEKLAREAERLARLNKAKTYPSRKTA